MKILNRITVLVILCSALLWAGTTLINLPNQVQGILAHINGGTDVNSPGTAGNVLTSTGTAWESAAPGTPVTGATALFDDFCNGNNASTLSWTVNGGGGGISVLPNTPIANHPCLREVNALSLSTWEYYILGTSNTGNEWFQVTLYSAIMSSSLTANTYSSDSEIRFGLFTNRGTQDSDGVFFELSDNLNGNNDWWCVTRTSGTRTTQDSGVSGASGYQILEFDFNATNTPVWKINGTSVCATLGAVNTAVMTPAYQVVDPASIGTQTKVWIDYFSLIWSGLVR